MPTDDMDLLREYARRNSEEAFATLIARHINLVYSVAPFEGNGEMPELCGTNVPISTLVGYLENKLKIPVVDKTGLEGNVDFVVHYPMGWRLADQENLKASLLNELGLELVPGREPIEMLVVKKTR